MVKYLKPGEDFGPQHFSRDFGFKNSAEDRHDARNHPSGTEDDEYGDGSYVERRARGGQHRDEHRHPHGDEVVHSERGQDGSTIRHHEHGGYSVHHRDGHIEHFDRGGHACYADGGAVFEDAQMRPGDTYYPGDARGTPMPADGRLRPGERLEIDKDYRHAREQEEHAHGGRIRRAMGGPVQQPALPTGAPGMPQPPGPAAGAASPMAHATITMPLSDAMQGAAKLVQGGRQAGARQTMGALAQAARRPPQAPAAPAAAGLAHGGRAPAFNPGGEKGKLHREMHIPEGETIPAGRLESAAHSDNPEVRRDAIRAQTMKKWHHGSR